MARRTSQGGRGWGSTLPSGTAQPDLPPVEAWGESNLDQRSAKSRSPNGEWSSTLPSPRRSAQLIRATRCRHAVFDVIAGEEGIRPQADAADRPQLVVLADIRADALVLEAVLELAEVNPDVVRRIGAGPALQPQAPVRMGPFEMHRIDRVFLALEPVARDLGLDDLAETVGPREEFPIRHQRPRLRPQMSPYEAAQFGDRVGLNL